MIERFPAARSALRNGGGSVSVNANGSITLAPASGQSVTLASGQLVLPVGSTGAPPLTWTGYTGSVGMYFDGTDMYALGASSFRASSLVAPDAGYIALGAAADVQLRRDAAATLAQRNGANPQTFRLYNTYTDASNYEFGALRWTSNQFQIVTGAAGTGATNRAILIKTTGAGNLFLGVDDGAYWQITPTTRDFSPVTSNSVDLGAATRKIRNAYFGGAPILFTKAGAPVDEDFTGPADGMICLDTTNHRLYARSGGSWRYTALT